MQYMPVVLLARAKEVRDDGSIVEIVVWELPEPLPPSTHRYKYRLYYGSGGASRVRYDNERGKGDHRHIGGRRKITSSPRLNNCLTTLAATSRTGGKP